MTTQSKKGAQPSLEDVAKAAGRRQMTLDDAAKKAGVLPLTPEEEARLDGRPSGRRQTQEPAEEPQEAAAVDDEADLSTRDADEAPPEWAQVPGDGFKLPPDGKEVLYIKIPGSLTDYKGKGDRQCIMWNLTYADEKNALKRCFNDPMRTTDEMTRQMIRAIDGRRVNWASPASPDGIDRWWDEIGIRARMLLKGIFVKRTSASQEERLDFFGNCVVETSSR